MLVERQQLGPPIGLETTSTSSTLSLDPLQSILNSILLTQTSSSTSSTTTDRNSPNKKTSSLSSSSNSILSSGTLRLSSTTSSSSSSSILSSSSSLSSSSTTSSSSSSFIAPTPFIVTSITTTTPSQSSSSTAAFVAKNNSFLANKPLSGAVFALVGIIVVAVAVLIITMYARRRHRERLYRDAISFDPDVEPRENDEKFHPDYGYNEFTDRAPLSVVAHSRNYHADPGTDFNMSDRYPVHGQQQKYGVNEASFPKLYEPSYQPGDYLPQTRPFGTFESPQQAPANLGNYMPQSYPQNDDSRYPVGSSYRRNDDTGQSNGPSYRHKDNARHSVGPFDDRFRGDDDVYGGITSVDVIDYPPALRVANR